MEKRTYPWQRRDHHAGLKTRTRRRIRWGIAAQWFVICLCFSIPIFGVCAALGGWHVGETARVLNYTVQGRNGCSTAKESCQKDMQTVVEIRQGSEDKKLIYDHDWQVANIPIGNLITFSGIPDEQNPRIIYCWYGSEYFTNPDDFKGLSTPVPFEFDPGR